MDKKTVRINLNVLLAALLVLFMVISAYLLLHIQGVYSVLREYNSRAALVQSDLNDMNAYVRTWGTALTYSETYQNYAYLKLISDNYNRNLPAVKQRLIEYRSFVEANSAVLVSVSINAPLEIKNVESLLEAYDASAAEFEAYLNSLLEMQNSTPPEG